MELTRYRCHKEVSAAKITEITMAPDRASAYLWFSPGVGQTVDAAWLRRHEPQVGGYYVVYDDGYASFSPAKAFEDGYSPIT